jgi:hypothetical protein
LGTAWASIETAYLVGLYLILAHRHDQLYAFGFSTLLAEIRVYGLVKTSGFKARNALRGDQRE